MRLNVSHAVGGIAPSQACGGWLAHRLISGPPSRRLHTSGQFEVHDEPSAFVSVELTSHHIHRCWPSFGGYAGPPPGDYAAGEPSGHTFGRVPVCLSHGGGGHPMCQFAACRYYLRLLEFQLLLFSTCCIARMGSPPRCPFQCPNTGCLAIHLAGTRVVFPG